MMMKTVRTFTLLLALTTPLSGCILAVAGAAGAGAGYYVSQDEREVSTIADDVAITTSIKTKLFRQSELNAFKIDVDTYDGIVTLYGSVPTRNEEQIAINLARNTEGTHSVISRLTIASEHGPTKRLIRADELNRPQTGHEEMPDELPNSGKHYPID